MNPVNQDVAGRLEKPLGYCASKEPIDIGSERACVRRRVSARCKRLWTKVLRHHGLEGLKQLPSVGESIARAIRA